MPRRLRRRLDAGMDAACRYRGSITPQHRSPLARLALALTCVCAGPIARLALALTCVCAGPIARLALALTCVCAGMVLAAGPTGASSATPGGLSLIVEPDQGLAQIDRYVAAARSSVEVTMYELDDPAIEAELVADRHRGVAVRVLLNGGYYGRGGFPENDGAVSHLRANGVAVRASPASFALTHQKTITIDGRTSLVMTLNLTSRYYSSTRDFALVDTQPADVAAIERVFNADWSDTAVTPSTGSGDLLWSPGAEGRQLALIARARSTLDVENEEMDDGDITAALCDASLRGVAVHVVMTYDGEWRDAFDELASCGVAVRTYAPDASLYIHAKVIIRDGREAFVGSQNFSWTSLQANRELGIVTSDPAVLGGLGRVLAADFRGAAAFAARAGSGPLRAADFYGRASPGSGTGDPPTKLG